jgi:type II secretory pathway pseudopilin PulG
MDYACGTLRKRRRGFTAFEALIAAVILAFLTSTVSTALMAGRAQSRMARDMVAASMLGQALMEEVMRLPVADPRGYKTVGPDPGEVRGTFDCVDDFDGYTDGPTGVTDLAGNAYPSGYQGFVRTVGVTTVSYTPAGWNRTVSGMLLTVTVKGSDGRELIKLQRLACN